MRERMTVNVEALLFVIETLAQNSAEQKPLKQRIRENAAAYAEMNLKVQEILRQRRLANEASDGTQG